MQDSNNLKLKRNLTSLVEFSRIINSSIDLEFILNNVLLTCLGKFLATRGLVAVNENKIIKLKNSKGLSDDLINSFPELEAVPDCTGSVKLNSFMKAAHLQEVERISSSDDCIGIVCLGEKLNKTDYSEDDKEFFRTILNISATAIQNSVAFNEIKKVNRKLDSRIQRLNALFELSKEFGLFSESTKVAKLLVFSVIGQFLVSRFAVVTFDADEVEVLESKFNPEVLIDQVKKYNLQEMGSASNRNLIREMYPGILELGIELIVPMQIQGKTKGLIFLANRVNKEEFKEADIEFIYSVGSLAIISLENKRLFQEALEKQKLEEELFIARDIQRNLLPQNVPEFGSFDISATNISSKQVGGDYYDVIQLDDENFCIAIADVSGKGVPASLLMANIQAFLQVICKQGMKIDEATGLINDLISENTTEGRFITFFWGIVNTTNKILTYVNAGHNPPLLLRNGAIQKLQVGGMILGVMSTMIPYSSDEIQLKENDALILFTDGVSEAMNKDGEEFSDERLEKTAQLLKEKSADEILNGIKKEVQLFSEGSPQSDDLTMLVMKVK